MGSDSTDSAELRSWSVSQTASRGSTSDAKPDLDANEERRLKKAAKDVRKSISGTTAALFHPNLNLDGLLANIRRYFDEAQKWNFPIGQNQALRKGYFLDKKVVKRKKDQSDVKFRKNS